MSLERCCFLSPLPPEGMSVPSSPFPWWAQASFSDELQVRKGCECVRLHKDVSVCLSVLGSNNS